ncbi:hypothetical protein KVR01_013323 [Diaporthe batatas]|uniref:uncharacterized protein n=1 Tax=Diaporthe batatas TaxID=748121 RepID=UPI001D048045|nr:uncharacterized protein KVR01_013323 [Diaporthe batatas]KAG8156910.1 hypothetical protein KVR01_013323 [Diaporthe batatas]
MSKLPKLLASLFHPPEGISIVESDRYQYYHNWGFTIYRTAYGATTDQQWLSLISKIEARALDEIEAHGASEPAAPTLRSLFRLDPRSDPDRLDGLSMDQVRELYQEGEANPRDGKMPIMHAYNPTRRHFLLADAEVLDAVGRDEFWVKCVQADYHDAHYVPKHPFMAGQAFLGWTNMTTRSILELWWDLANRDLVGIAPPVIKGQQTTLYDGELTGHGR